LHCNANKNFNKQVENEGRESQILSNTTTQIKGMVMLTRESVQCGDFLQFIFACRWPREAATCAKRISFQVDYLTNLNVFK
jgi:hypothetical protein